MKSAMERKKKETFQGQLHIGYPGDEWVERGGGGGGGVNLTDFCVEIMRGHIRQILTEWSIKKKSL